MGGRGTRNKNEARTNISGLVNGKGVIEIPGAYGPLKVNVAGEHNGFIVHKSVAGGNTFTLSHAGTGHALLTVGKKQDMLNILKTMPKLSAKGTNATKVSDFSKNDLAKMRDVIKAHRESRGY